MAQLYPSKEIPEKKAPLTQINQKLASIKDLLTHMSM